MREFIAFQKYVPAEIQNNKKCIWCGSEYKRNKAHIVTKKLSHTSNVMPILKYNICKKCNTKCGYIEEWILKNTPLSWIRLFIYTDSNRGATTENIPSYFFDIRKMEWLIYHLKASKKIIDDQLIKTKEGRYRYYTQNADRTLYKNILSKIDLEKIKYDIKPELPEDFSPRAILSKGFAVIIVKSKSDLTFFMQDIERIYDSTKYEEDLYQTNPEENIQHFKWSSANWTKFSGKIAFESLCLFEGPLKCLDSSFDRLKEYVLSGVSKDIKEIIFDNNGPMSSNDIPNFINVDLSLSQSFPKPFTGMLSHAELGMHVISIFEIEGWICSSVSIAGLPPVFLVLSGPNTHLDDYYIMIYDNDENEFTFMHLADNQYEPLIPIRIDGRMNERIKSTYKLITI